MYHRKLTALNLLVLFNFSPVQIMSISLEMLLKALTHLVYLKFEYRVFMTKLPFLPIRAASRPVVLNQG